MRVHVEDKGLCFYGPFRHWRQCLVTCGAISEGRGCRFLTILCSRMYVSLDVCSNMLLIKCYVDYLFYYFKHFLVLLFLIICIFVVSLPFCNIFICSHVLFIMLCFICLYMFLPICLYIVSDDENKDDQSKSKGIRVKLFFVKIKMRSKLRWWNNPQIGAYSNYLPFPL